MYNLKDKQKKEYFIEIVPNHTTKEIIELYEAKFNEKMSKYKVEDLKKRFNLHSKTKYKYNNEKLKDYKKRIIGSERIDNRGFIRIKIAEPDKWQRKHIYVYEKYYGKIPKGKVIVFLDGNKQNCNIDNLVLVDKREQLLMAKMNLYFKDKEISRSGIVLAKLLNKINKIEKGE